MSHPLVDQLRFTRSEYHRNLEGLTNEDAAIRFMPMNCIAWNVGHLAWHEQRYFITYPDGRVLFPELNELFAYGAPASTPNLEEMWAAWETVTAAADPWLESLTSEKLLEKATNNSKPASKIWGNILQRVIYHYWYHLGENAAIRQHLGQTNLPQFVGDIDHMAPYRPA